MKQLKFKILSFSLLLFIFQANAQLSDIKEIKKYYYDISEKIAACNQTEVEACQIYRNDLTINSNGERTINWPATGNYIKKITFWYDKAPAHWDEKGLEALLRIDYTEVYAANSDSYEFIFKDGKLIFCFYKQSDVGEFRYYLSNNKLIDFIGKYENQAVEENKEAFIEIINMSKKLQDFFLIMF